MRYNDCCAKALHKKSEFHQPQLVDSTRLTIAQLNIVNCMLVEISMPPKLNKVSDG